MQVVSFLGLNRGCVPIHAVSAEIAAQSLRAFISFRFVTAVRAFLKFENATMEKETLFTITSILLNNSDNEISSCDSSDESENEDDINLLFTIGINIHIINCKRNTRTD